MDSMHAEGYYVKILCEKIKIKEVMTSPALTVFEDEELSAVEEKFIHNRVFYFPVVDRSLKLVGLVSHKYIYKTQSPRKFLNDDAHCQPGIIIEGDSYYHKETLDSYILRHIMFKNPFTLGPEDTLAEAVRSMAARNISCIPIVDADRRVAGVLTGQESVAFLAKFLG